MAIVNEDTTLSELLQKNRIDAEYYLPEYVSCEAIVKQAEEGYSILRHIAIVTDGDHSVRKYQKQGILFLTSENIDEFVIDYNSSRYISESYDQSLKRSRSEQDAVFISKTGKYYGKAAICVEEEPIFNIPADVGKITVKDTEKVNPYYLTAYLNSHIGRMLVRRENSGGTRDRITLINLGRVPIPIIKDDGIKGMILEYISLRRNSERQYSQAEEILNNELGLNRISRILSTITEVSISRIVSANRFDSEHYPQAYNEIKATIERKGGAERLNKFQVFNQRGKQPRYLKTGMLVVNSKHVRRNKVILENNRWGMIPEGQPLYIEQGNLLINGTGVGTIGRCAPFLYKQTALPDNHVTVLKVTSINVNYLSVYLNSLAGQIQVQMFQRGSSGQLELYPHDISRFLIWDAPEEIQNEIGESIQSAFEADELAKKLLLNIKTRIEKLLKGSSISRVELITQAG